MLNNPVYFVASLPRSGTSSICAMAARLGLRHQHTAFDLPGGDWDTLLESIKTLIDTHPPETHVFPGHMGVTTLASELATNPFLAEMPR